MRDATSWLLVFATVLGLGRGALAQQPCDEGARSADTVRLARLSDSSPTRIAGRVVANDGLPVREAVVVSSVGGKALTDEEGRFALALDVGGLGALGLTAVSSARGSAQVATRRVELRTARAHVDVGDLELQHGAQCVPQWLPTFGQLPGAHDTVLALAVYDDGQGGGPALYAAGAFHHIGNAVARRIARWDGTTWSPLAAGADDTVWSLAVYDDGRGPALYAGGYFTSVGDVPANRIARWDGDGWEALGPGVDSHSIPMVRALAVFDDGAGPALFAGGEFTSAGGASATRIARWDGTSWSALGAGLNNWVYGLAVFDDGGGPALFAGGSFTTAGGASASRIAKWDGASWSALGAGTSGTVEALTTYDDGSGLALYAGGGFSSAGDNPASRIARWDGNS